MLIIRHEETASEYRKGLQEKQTAKPADSWQRKGFGRLERSTVKVVCSVLKGVGSGNRARLPGAVLYALKIIPAFCVGIAGFK